MSSVVVIALKVAEKIVLCNGAFTSRESVGYVRIYAGDKQLGVFQQTRNFKPIKMSLQIKGLIRHHYGIYGSYLECFLFFFINWINASQWRYKLNRG